MKNYNANPIEQVLNKFVFTDDCNQVGDQVQQLLDAKFDENDTKAVYGKLISYIDLTSLSSEDTDESIIALVKKVNCWGIEHQDLPNVAAICTYPNFAGTVQSYLEIDKIKNVSVAGAFPSAQTFTEVKIAEVALAIADGAEEIDVVLPLGLFHLQDYQSLVDELSEIKISCRNKILKIILETGALANVSEIYKAAILAIYSGADFIKTSTGKIPTGASPEAVYVMCKALKKYNELYDKKIGLKVAGGIDSIEKAVQYYTIVKEVLGEDWLTPSLFRIGASRLFDTMASKIV